MDRRTFFGSVAALIGVGFVKSTPAPPKKDEWEWHEVGWEYCPLTQSWTYYSRVFDAALPNTLTVIKK